MKKYLFFYLCLMFCGCIASQKQDTQSASNAEKPTKTTELTDVKADDSSSTQTAKAPVIDQKKVSKETADIDTLKIYEAPEASRAVPNMSNKEIYNFYTKHFKYPDMEPITGDGWVYCIVEPDGSVSDVKIEKGIHPELDKEFIRVIKLMPLKFNPPGKIKGIPVRSKYRMMIGAMAGE